MSSPILVINTGSSSLKFGLYVNRDGDEQPLLDGLVDGIGRSSGKLAVKDPGGRTIRSEDLISISQPEALVHAARCLSELSRERPSAIGHRVVHGGPRLAAHQAITLEVKQELQAATHFAPLHIPTALQLIEESERRYPDVPQFACFDTVFHNTLPEAASRFPIPGDLFDRGIRRYGFHGLSYESIIHKLGRGLAARTVIAHLGNGASLAAVKNGLSIDTTMGLTPTGGIPMATRSGDLDPGVLLFLLRSSNKTPDSLEELLNRRSGLVAISGGQADMRNLEAKADAGDQKSRLAIDVFCNSVRKAIAAYAAALSGIDMLIFSGGIGEHSARVRTKVCTGLEFLGLEVNARSNELHDFQISTPDSKVRVKVVKSEEDRQIARHCRQMLGASA